ncbi:glutathionylspermidine synthase family protein [Neoroseomonas oryzicola]|uniref:glutathionylspermidine synthase family protein n=1 Tax=Neoroseomonas oryzicola TaxID=535904 RepID=UPI001BAD56E9
MERRRLDPRPDRRDRARRMGFAFADIEGEAYWDESAYYRFTEDEVDVLEAATGEIERISREAVAYAVANDLNEPLGIPPGAWPIAKRSWERGEPSLYGRIDLRWDGTGAPKLLEYNADTPTALFEAAVVQWEWLQCLDDGHGPDNHDQFNGLHEALIEAWPRLGLPPTVHFCCHAESVEDRGTVDYLRDTAMQAGFDAPFLAMEEIGWNGVDFTDLEERPIEAMFKLYPWDWLLREAFGADIPHARTRWIEPAWRLIPASKAFLSLLWHLYPDHPNLLAAFLEPGRTGKPEIVKPLWGREGSNISAPGIETDGPYADQPRVWQEYAELPVFGGRYPVLGSWIIAGEPRGLGIREDATPVTRDTSRFVPHLFD